MRGDRAGRRYRFVGVLPGGIMHDPEIVKGELDNVTVGGLHAISKTRSATAQPEAIGRERTTHGEKKDVLEMRRSRSGSQAGRGHPCTMPPLLS